MLSRGKEGITKLNCSKRFDEGFITRKSGRSEPMKNSLKWRI